LDTPCSGFQHPCGPTFRRETFNTAAKEIDALSPAVILQDNESTKSRKLVNGDSVDFGKAIKRKEILRAHVWQYGDSLSIGKD
jgi:hypothetical protein